MPGIEVGRVCIKTRGRNAGKKVVIVDLGKEEKFVTVDGKEVKRKRCNARHLFPTKEKIKIKKGASHSEVVKLLK